MAELTDASNATSRVSGMIGRAGWFTLIRAGLHQALQDGEASDHGHIIDSYCTIMLPLNAKRGMRHEACPLSPFCLICHCNRV